MPLECVEDFESFEDWYEASLKTAKTTEGGYIEVFDFFSSAENMHPVETAIWVFVIEVIQENKGDIETPMIIERNPNNSDHRTLYVHPDMVKICMRHLGEIEYHRHSCCGGGCIMEDIQEKSARVSLNRLWKDLDLSDKIRLRGELTHEVGGAKDYCPIDEWINTVDWPVESLVQLQDHL
jgi:hypothetical protein